MFNRCFSILLQKGNTALHESVLLKNTKACNALCYEDADINARDKDGRTPLMLACQQGYPAFVKMLCEYEADCTVKDNSGKLSLRRI